jgi:hypothetical protein
MPTLDKKTIRKWCKKYDDPMDVCDAILELYPDASEEDFIDMMEQVHKQEGEIKGDDYDDAHAFDWQLINRNAVYADQTIARLCLALVYKDLKSNKPKAFDARIYDYDVERIMGHDEDFMKRWRKRKKE